MFLLVPLLFSCGSQSIDIAEDCDVRIYEISPSEGQAGDTVSATLRPTTTIWDTAVYVDGDRAEVVEINRENCEACDQCKEDFGCLDCDDCDDCDLLCRTDCVESASFIVPEITPGQSQVIIYNGHGGSNAYPLMVTGNIDTGDTSDDSGVSDSGTPVDSSAYQPTYVPPPSGNAPEVIHKEP